MAFSIIETTIDQVHAAYKSGELTCRQLVQMYLDRIAAYDKKRPGDQCDYFTQSRRARRGRPARCRSIRPRAPSDRCTASRSS